MSARILCCDPGLANFGIAIVELGSSSDRVMHLEVLRTKPSNRKQRVLQCDDNVRRARDLAEAISDLLFKHQPVAVCAEAMSHPRHAASAGKLLLAWGVFAACIEAPGLPLAQASPRMIKKVATGNRGASKIEVERAVRAHFAESRAMLDALSKGQREHAADALGAFLACRRSDVIRMARKGAA